MKLNRREKFLCRIGLTLMVVSTIMGILVRTNQQGMLLSWKIVLIATDACWWLMAKEHFKDVEDDIFSFKTEVIEKEAFEIIPLALAGGMIGTMIF